MPFIIPTILTAVDRFSPTFRAMNASLATFDDRLGVVGARSERMFGRLTMFNNSFIKEIKDRTNFIVELGASMTVLGTAALSFKSLADYEDAVASFRVIVSDLNDVEFGKFKNQIAKVAEATNKSSTDVAKSFEKIAGLNPMFAKTAEGLGLVSTASIVLAKASRMDIGEASISLVGIMNQFNLEADQSIRTMNALAAGQALGASSISQTAISLTKFGAIAKAANITMEQSIALVQVFGKKGFFAEDAGFMLSSAIQKLQAAGYGYKNGAFSLGSALNDLKSRYDALKSPMAQNMLLESVFDITQKKSGLILMENIELFKYLSAGVTGTNEGYKAAAINTDTLSNRLVELKNKYITIITTSDKVGIGFNFIKKSVVLLTDHLEGLVTIAAAVLGAFTSWAVINKIILGIRAAYVAWNFALGVNNYLQGQAIMLIGTNTAALNGYTMASRLALLGTQQLGAAIGTAFTALIAAYGIYKTVMNEVERRENEKNRNPLKFDYAEGANSKHNKSIRSRYGISEDEFNTSKKYHDFQDKSALKDGEYYNLVGGKTKGFDWSNTIWSKDYGKEKKAEPIKDSTDIKAFMRLRDQEKSDTVFHKEVVLTIKSESGKILGTFNTETMMPTTSSTWSTMKGI